MTSGRHQYPLAQFLKFYATFSLLLCLAAVGPGPLMHCSITLMMTLCRLVVILFLLLGVCRFLYFPNTSIVDMMYYLLNIRLTFLISLKTFRVGEILLLSLCQTVFYLLCIIFFQLCIEAMMFTGRENRATEFLNRQLIPTHPASSEMSASRWKFKIKILAFGDFTCLKITTCNFVLTSVSW